VRETLEFIKMGGGEKNPQRELELIPHRWGNIGHPTFQRAQGPQNAFLQRRGRETPGLSVTEVVGSSVTLSAGTLVCAHISLLMKIQSFNKTKEFAVQAGHVLQSWSFCPSQTPMLSFSVYCETLVPCIFTPG
jgi:diaminopimelate epimerase